MNEPEALPAPRTRHTSSQEAARPLAASRRPLDAWWLASIPMLLFFALPVILLVLRASPAELWENLQQPAVRQAIHISLRTTLISLVLTLVLGTPLAYVIGRRQFRFKRLLDALIDLPAVLPPAVAGVALLIAFGRRGMLGGGLEALGLQIAFTQVAVILAQVFVSAPFYVRSAAVGFANLNEELEEAAQLDGASDLQIFRQIILPLSRVALVSGAMLAWARALGEFGATMIFAGNLPGQTQTMSTAIYLGFEVDLDIAITLSVLLLAISFLVMALVKSLSREAEA